MLQADQRRGQMSSWQQNTVPRDGHNVGEYDMRAVGANGQNVASKRTKNITTDRADVQCLKLSRRFVV
jgi:hypothetical protein